MEGAYREAESLVRWLPGCTPALDLGPPKARFKQAYLGIWGHMKAMLGFH